MAQQAYHRDQVSKIKAKATDEVDKSPGRAEAAANGAPDQGREVSESLETVARNLKAALDSSVKEQSVATLVAAAIVGFLLGALWKS